MSREEGGRKNKQHFVVSTALSVEFSLQSSYTQFLLCASCARRKLFGGRGFGGGRERERKEERDRRKEREQENREREKNRCDEVQIE